MNKDKAYFLPRLMAYLIDLIIISLIVSVVSIPFEDKNIENLNKEYNDIVDKYTNNKIDNNEFINQYMDISYDLNYKMVPINIINLSIIILYYVIYQSKNNGQTIGKKLMKIKIISNDVSDITTNDYVFRSFILNGLLISILDLILILFVNRKYYFYLSFPLQIIQIILILITVFMILFRKDGRGLHDKVSNMKVIME